METVAKSSTNHTSKISNKKSSAAALSLGYDKQASKEIVEVLNQLLADYSVHYQKVRNYHWNVKGEDFFDLHEQFENLYNEARLHIDEIAERIRVFGETPYSTMADYLKYSNIKETGTDLDSTDMVKEVLADFRVLLEQMDKVVSVAIEIPDGGTEEMIKDYIHGIQKHHWMLSAFVANK